MAHISDVTYKNVYAAKIYRNGFLEIIYKSKISNIYIYI